MKIHAKFFVTTISITFVFGCAKINEHVEQKMLAGTVRNVAQEKRLFPAYIFNNDELIATTDNQGNYEITTIEAGNFTIKCSAVGYADAKSSITIREGKLTTLDFNLIADETNGRVYGEFHDSTLFSQQLAVNPSMLEWNSKELFDGISGATLQEKTLNHEVPERKVKIGNCQVACSDGFGQYWFTVQCGTYPLNGSCDGYNEKQQIIVVKPNDRLYVNFVLEKE